MSKNEYQTWLWNKVVDDYYNEATYYLVTEVA